MAINKKPGLSKKISSYFRLGIGIMNLNGIAMREMERGNYPAIKECLDQSLTFKKHSDRLFPLDSFTAKAINFVVLHIYPLLFPFSVEYRPGFILNLKNRLNRLVKRIDKKQIDALEKEIKKSR